MEIDSNDSSIWLHHKLPNNDDSTSVKKRKKILKDLKEKLESLEHVSEVLESKVSRDNFKTLKIIYTVGINWHHVNEQRQTENDITQLVDDYFKKGESN